MGIRTTFLSKAVMFFGVSVLFLSKSFSQTTVWEKTNALNQFIFSSQKPEVDIFELNTTTFEKYLEEIDQDHLKAIRFPSSKKNEFITYKVRQTQVMHPDLVKKYPNIKSYKGFAVAHEEASIDFVYNTKTGLHGVMEMANHKKIEIHAINSSLHEFVLLDQEKMHSDFDCHTSEQILDQSTNFGVFDRNVNDGRLRKYRLALSVSGDYSQTFLDGTEANDTERKEKVLQAMVNSVNRLNEIFERDLGISLQLIPETDQLIFLNPFSDPYSTGDFLSAELSRTINNTVDQSSYDVGHLFHKENNVYGNAGCIACVCTSNKALAYSVHRSPETDGMNLLAAHEFGHQFGAYHTQSSRVCRSGRNSEVEPGSGSTIMSYAGICSPNVQLFPDDYFNYTSIRDIAVWTINNSSCAELIPSFNTAPVVEAGTNYIIPISTPFVLEGQATDVDNDVLTYCWEQNDTDNPNSSLIPNSTRVLGPIFRSLPPTTSNKRYFPSFIHTLNNNLTPVWETLPSVSRNLNFVLTVRDNNPKGGQVTSDTMQVSTESSAGPFVVTSQSLGSEKWTVGNEVTLTWEVANTNIAPINTTEVEVFLSTDGGSSFPTKILTTANDGVETFELPDVASTSEARILIKAVDNIYFAVNRRNFSIEKSEYVINIEEANISSCNTGNITYALEYKTFLSFDEEVTLSVSNLPTGVTASWSQNIFNGNNVGGTPFSLTLSGTHNLSIGSYEIVVEALSTSGIQQSIPLQFSVFSNENTTVNLLSPANNSNSQELTTELTWDVITNATSYLLEIATDNTFNTIIESEEIEEERYTPSNLINNQQYYWRVQFSNPCANSDFSEIYAFTTECSTPFSFEEAQVTLSTIGVSWEDSIDSNSWTVEYGVAGFALGSGITQNVTTKNFEALALNSGTDYDFYVKGNCSVGGESGYVGPLTVKTAADFCSGDHFYDSGGEFGNYSDNEKTSTTIYPDVVGNRVRVAFEVFDLEFNFDRLEIYDGESEQDLSIGVFSGNELVGREFVSTHHTGALTFVFTSDFSVVRRGWDASVICEVKPNCPEPVNFQSTLITHNQANFEWIITSIDSNWELEYGLTGFSIGSGEKINTTNPLISISDLLENTTYDIYIKTICNIGGFSEIVGPVSFTTTERCPAPGIINVENVNFNSAFITWENIVLNNAQWDIEYGRRNFAQGSGTLISVSQNNASLINLTSNTEYQFYLRSNCNAEGISSWVGPIDFKTSLDYCGGDHFYDSGGEFGNYSDNERTTTTIYPNHSDERVKIIFNTFLIEQCCDRLLVYDGPDTSSPIIETITALPDRPIASSHETGALTFVFISDSSVTRNGWDASIICEAKPNCVAPTNLRFANLQSRQVAVFWDQNDTTTDWTIEYGVAGFTIGEGNEVIADTPTAIIENLLPETSYDIYVKANCSIGGFSDLSRKITLRTPELCSTPNRLTINNVTKNSAEIAWDADVNASGWEVEYYTNFFTPGTGVGNRLITTTNTVAINNLTSDTGYHVAVRKNCGTDGFSNWTFLQFFRTEEACQRPENFIVKGLQTRAAELAWDADVNASGWEVEYDTNFFTPGTGVANQLITTTNTVTINNLTPDTEYYVAVRKNCAGEGFSRWTFIQSFRTEEVCRRPTSFIVLGVQSRTAELTWDADVNASEWEVEYDTNFFTPGIGVANRLITTTNTVTINNLTPDTEYYAAVRQNCGVDGFSNWTFLQFFRTEEACPRPSNFIVLGVQSRTAELTWDADVNASEWEVEYDTSFFTPGIGVANQLITTTNTVTINNLTPDTEYYAAVRQNCGVDGFSNWTFLQFFRTETSCAIPSNFRGSSAKANEIKLDWDNDIEINEWEIEYSTVIFAPGTGLGNRITSSTNSITINNLSSATTYYLALRKNCGIGEFSNWTNLISYSTVCANTNNEDNNYIVNGSFECGSTAGWNVEGTPTGNFPGSCSQNFNVLDNSSTICVIVEDIFPTHGTYAAFTSFDGNTNSTYILSQEIALPSTIQTLNSAILSYDFKVNYMLTFGFPTRPRVFTVKFNDLFDNELFVVDVVEFGITQNTGSIDLSIRKEIASQLAPYIGQTIKLSFEAFVPESFTGPSKAMIDNVSLILDYEENVLEEPVTTPTTPEEEITEILEPVQEFTNEKIKLYPVPNNGNFTIDNNLGDTIDKVEFYDISGKLVTLRNITFNSNVLEMKMKGIFSSGVYFIKIYMKSEIQTLKMNID